MATSEVYPDDPEAPEVEAPEAAEAEMSDDDLLATLKREREASIGFDLDADLTSQRDKAIEYSRGIMSDVPVMDNRSQAMSSDVADAIETAMPDLIEIFLGGDDVVTFRPNSAQDEDAAKQETDYVRHVVFKENDGFGIFYAAFKDALLAKTGLFKFDWYPDSETITETFQGQSAPSVQAAQQYGEISDLKPSEQTDPSGGAEPLYDFTLTCTKDKGRLVIDACPPEDFTVGADTVKLRDATYCAMRSRKRAQTLVADGFDAADIADLPAYSAHSQDTTARARDTVSEGQQTGEEGVDNLRMIEIVEHTIRLAGPDGKLQLWRVVTGDNEAVVLRKDKVNRVGFADLTPYIVPHRFYGQSIGDKLMEVQRIKTALTRMVLDSGYFALNQRTEVADDQSNEFTLDDVTANVPGLPIRSKNGNAVRPIPAAGLGFDGFSALEYFSTVGEQRSGIVRNAQGLNPDTLHDTASGALALIAAAQKRIRLIARIFAETGLKDLFLGVHATLRENATKAATIRLRKQWVEINPSEWSEREDMDVDVGQGGRDHDLAVLKDVMGMQQTIVGAQGGLEGPLVTASNAYDAVSSFTDRAGLRTEFFTDPKSAPQGQPKPDPKAAEMQAQLQLQQAKNQGDLQIQQAKAASDAQLANQQAIHEANLQEARLNSEQALKREQLAAEVQLKRDQMVLDHQFRMAQPKTPSSDQPVQFGGEPG